MSSFVLFFSPAWWRRLVSPISLNKQYKSSVFIWSHYGYPGRTHWENSGDQRCQDVLSRATFLPGHLSFPWGQTVCALSISTVWGVGIERWRRQASFLEISTPGSQRITRNWPIREEMEQWLAPPLSQTRNQPVREEMEQWPALPLSQPRNRPIRGEMEPWTRYSTSVLHWWRGKLLKPYRVTLLLSKEYNHVQLPAVLWSYIKK